MLNLFHPHRIAEFYGAQVFTTDEAESVSRWNPVVPSDMSVPFYVALALWTACGGILYVGELSEIVMSQIKYP